MSKRIHDVIIKHEGEDVIVLSILDTKNYDEEKLHKLARKVVTDKKIKYRIQTRKRK